MNASREILTPELEAEISALYRQMQASRALPVERDTMTEQESGPRMLTALLGVLFIAFTLGVGAWIIAHFVRFSVR